MSRQNKQRRLAEVAKSIKHSKGGRTKSVHGKVKRIDGSTNHIAFNKGKR
jgi:hypothetical protein